MSVLPPGEMQAFLEKADRAIKDARAMATALAAKMVFRRAVDKCVAQPLSSVTPPGDDAGDEKARR